MTRTVADAAAELGAIAGKDPEDPETATAPDTVPDYLGALSTTALQGKRIGIINSNNAQYQAAVTAIQALGAVTVNIGNAPSNNAPDILTYEFKRDMNAYLARLPASAPMKTLHDIRLYNDAHTQEALKFGQTQVIASDNVDLVGQRTTYEANRATSRGTARTAIDTALTNNNIEAIMTPATTMTVIGARAGYPQLVVPAGYSANARNPVGIAFNGGAFSEAKLLAFGYAYEQATKLRIPPSQENPSMWRCVPGNAYVVARGSCAPGEPANADAIATTVGGTVPATLSLTLGPAASFGAFTPGLAKEYTAQTTANVISTAGSAALSVSDPGHLMNGTFSLPEALRVEIAPNAWSAPVSNAASAITFRQHIGATDALRTGSYSKTLTFTLSTTEP
jgi:amidase